MIINWPLIIVLFCLSLPGVCIAMTRLIYFLLPNNTEELKKRMSRMVIVQTLFMVFVMSLAGAVLSLRTGLKAPVLEAFLNGKGSFSALLAILLPSFLYAFGGLVIFCGLYYGIIASILDDHSFQVMNRVRRSLGIDGCVLYGGVVEEVIARWGLMNVLSFFVLMFTQQNNLVVVWISIFLSAVLFAVGQIPLYLASGAHSSRRLIYSILILSLWQSLLFGFVFWQYGLLASILAHMLFHLGWGLYDQKNC
jgi:hypothetical protein